MDRTMIHKDTYHDSVFLMAVSAELARGPALAAAHVVLATPANVQLLTEQGFDAGALDGLTPTDLVIALRAEAEETLEQAAAQAQQLLSAAAGGDRGDGTQAAPVGLDGGLERLPGADLALISVPGEYAALEASKAMARGLSVMIFSDNVATDDEVALKQQASRQGLLCMGPDCGTSLIRQIPLGFANRVRPGPVGLVGASGTGLQEVSCQIHRLGGGVTHILGTGGRDLSPEVGGATTLAALDLFAENAETRVLVVVSKPPAPQVADRVVARLAAMDEPSVIIFLGEQGRRVQPPVHVAHTLAEAAAMAVRLARGEPAAGEPEPHGRELQQLIGALTPDQRWIHGLFCGGTLASEAVLLLGRAGLDVESNLGHGHQLPSYGGHTAVDLGDDRFTRGRPHPMIEPSQRNEQIVALGSRPQTAALLLDVVLGSGSHTDPAGAALPALRQARQANPGLLVVASVTGTDLDAQGLSAQQQKLRDAGVLVLPSNAVACSLVAELALAICPTTEEQR